MRKERRLSLEYQSLDDVLKRCHPDNPKGHDLRALAASVHVQASETGGRPAELFRFAAETAGSGPPQGLALPLLRES